MTTLLLVKAEGEASKVFTADQLQEAKEHLHMLFKKEKEIWPNTQPVDFFVEELEAGKDPKAVYYYDPDDFLSPLAKHNTEYVKNFVTEGLVRGDDQEEMLEYLDKHDLIIKRKTSNLSVSASCVVEHDPPKVKKVKLTK